MKALKIFLLITLLSVIVFYVFDYQQDNNSLFEKNVQERIINTDINKVDINQTDSETNVSPTDSLAVVQDVESDCNLLKSVAIIILTDVESSNKTEASKIKISKNRLLELYQNTNCIDVNTIDKKCRSMNDFFNLIEKN